MLHSRSRCWTAGGAACTAAKPERRRAAKNPARILCGLWGSLNRASEASCEGRKQHRAGAKTRTRARTRTKGQSEVEKNEKTGRDGQTDRRQAAYRPRPLLYSSSEVKARYRIQLHRTVIVRAPCGVGARTVFPRRRCTGLAICACAVRGCLTTTCSGRATRAGPVSPRQDSIVTQSVRLRIGSEGQGGF